MLVALLLSSAAAASPWCGTPHRVAAWAERRAEPGPVVAQAAPPDGVCLDPQALADGDGVDGLYDQRLQTDRFLLAWDDANPVVDAAVAQAYADALELAWTVQIDELGWPAPDRVDECLITVVLADLPASSGIGGYTNVAQYDGVPYLVLNTDWLDYGDPWRSTLTAHELNHAIQFGQDAFWELEDWWYWEATAEWIPDLVDDAADTYVWNLWSYLYAPHLALSSREEWVDYGHFTFNTHLEEQHDVDVPRQLWVAAAGGGSFADAMAEVGLDFDAVTIDWVSHVGALDVAEQAVWRDAIDYFAIDMYAAEVDAYPAEGGSKAATAPQERGHNFLRFTGGSDTLHLAFAGDAEVGVIKARWALAVARVSADGTVAHEVVYADDDGNADVYVDGFGDDVAEVIVGAVPLGRIGEVGAAYDWSAELVEGAPAEDTGQDEVAEERPSACGCATTRPTWAWAVALAPFVALGRLRSRSGPSRRTGSSR